MTSIRVTRRDFLRVSAVGGGLLLGITLPGCSRRSGGPGPAPDVWVRIDPDDAVTITVAKSEMGQGVRTSLAMLVAEELDANWSRVKVAQADLNDRYGDQGTGGSGSVRSGYRKLREAGAALRAMLVAAAAEQWKVPASECRTEGSVVSHSSGRQLRYGELAAAAASQTVPRTVSLKPRTEWRILGRDRGGIDVPDIVHGRAVYGLDVKIPGMTYAVIERAHAFGATVKSFDAQAAKAVPGVLDVVEIKPVPDVHVPAGVAVVAENTWAALEGRRALQLEWNPSPHAGETTAGAETFMRQALQSPGTEVVNRIGDPDAVLAGASRVYRAEFEAPYISHATMEPMNCTASVQGNQAEIWSPTQFPDWATGATASALGIPGRNVTMHVTLLGGGFGRRINPDFTVEAALVSQKAGRPVKVVWTREDDLRHDFYRPCAMHRIEAALGEDGFPVAWRHRLTSAAIDASGSSERRNGFGASEADGAGNMSYRVPNRSLEYTLLESGVPRGWWRAVHTTHTTFAVESFIDELAEAAGRDPLEYRLALIDQVTVERPGIGSPEFPFSPERLKGVLRLAAEQAGWGTPLPPGRFRGIACGYDHLSYAAEVVEVSRVDGGVRIEKVVCAADCGPVMNPTGARAQLEGAIVQALSAATRERITIANGGVEQSNFDNYPLLRIGEAPLVIETYFAETDTNPSGLGEPAVPPLAPALANAVTRATGQRPRSLPFRLA